MKQLIKVNPPQQTAGSLFIMQVIFGTGFTFLTGGIFLSGFAIYMGASDLLVSYISMIANICGISILFFSSLIGRFHNFKKITIGLTICSKLTTLLIILIPLLVPSKTQILVFVLLMIFAFTLQAQTTVVLNNWMVTFLDEQQSGRYIALRQAFVLSVTIILSLVGGRLLDAVSGAYIGFVILFLVALLMAVLEIISLLQIPDAPQQRPIHKKMSFSDMIWIPMKSKLFFHFVLYIFLFYLALSLADSFTVVYMMRYLELPYTTTTIMQMLISLPQILLLGVWGRLSDKKGAQFTLTTSIWFFIGETLFLGLSNSQNLYVFLPIAFLFAAVANAGFTVSVFNRRYALMPQEGRILYDNFYSAAVGLAFILGPVIGGAVKLLLESSYWIKSSIPFGNIRLLYGVSTILIIILQIIFTVPHKKNKSFYD